jgi:anti-sigma factor RsiW
MDRASSHGPEPAARSPCEAFSADIHLLVDRELDATDAQRVEAHLQVCPRCLALAEQLERMSGLLRAWDQRVHALPPPAGRLRHAVLGRVAEHGARRRRDGRSLRLAHLATAALVLVVLGLGAVLGSLTRPGSAPASRVARRAPRAAAVPGVPARRAPRAPDAGAAAGAPAGDLGAEDLLAAVTTPPSLARAAEVRLAAPGPWDPDAFAPRDHDGLVTLDALLARKQAFEARCGVQAILMPGLRPGDAPRLVTGPVYRYLMRGERLGAWMRAATPRSPSVPTRLDPSAPGMSTGLSARDLLRPMPGLDLPLKLGAGTWLAAVARGMARGRGVGTPAGGAAIARLYALREPAPTASRLRSAPAPEAPLSFLDPIRAWGEGQLRLDESGTGVDTLVATVQGTTQPIFIPAGQLVSGGLGDRIVAHPTWLPASRKRMRTRISCRLVQAVARTKPDGAPQLEPTVVGPTLRALLAAGASAQQVRDAARRMVEAVAGGTSDPWSWSLRPFYEGRAEAYGPFYEHVRWGDARGFVVTDADGRLLGCEVVRASGPAATELLARLWLGYVADAVARARHGDSGAFAAPAEPAARAFSDLGRYEGLCRVPVGADAPYGARVSHLDVEDPGLALHALEVGGRPAVVSVLSSKR